MASITPTTGVTTNTTLSCVRYVFGNEVDWAVGWESTDPTIATVDNTGLVTVYKVVENTAWSVRLCHGAGKRPSG